MVNPATVTGPGKGNAAPPAPVVPFVRAALEHTESFLDWSATITTASTIVGGGPVDVPAYGFLRSILLLVTASGGTGAAAVYRQDAPWTVINEVALLDVNGAPLVGPFGGYDLYLVNRYGGYSFTQNPLLSPGYTAPTTAGNFQFMLRIPVEVSRRDALGALPNMNSASPYKLRLTQGALTEVYSTNPTTSPTIRWRCWLEAWTPPAPTGPAGEVQAVQPPALGTAQFWSKTTITTNSGAQTLRLPRVGNLIRNIILVWRDTTPARTDATLADPLTLLWDGRIIFQASQLVLQQYISERNAYTTNTTNSAFGGMDAGVYAISGSHDFDGHTGDEMRDLWLPTTQSTRLEVQGTFGANGSLAVLTNDVSPQGNVFVG